MFTTTEVKLHFETSGKSLFINDLPDVSKALRLILFADDTNLFFSHKDPAFLTNIVKAETDVLSEWFRANKLALNLDKTKFMVFKPKQKKTCYDINLHTNNKKITQVSETVFSGVILDEHLLWKQQIAYVANKVSKSARIIFKSSFYLFKTNLRTLYFSLVYLYSRTPLIRDPFIRERP